jgi:WD40 repeat protein
VRRRQPVAGRACRARRGQMRRGLAFVATVLLAIAAIGLTVALILASTREATQSAIEQFAILHPLWAPSRIAWSPDGTRLATCGSDTIWIYSVPAFELVDTLQLHESDITDIEWCPDGTMLASAGRDDIIQVWNTISGQPVTTIDGAFIDLEWSLDGGRLGGFDPATLYEESLAQFWDTSNYESVSVLRAGDGFADSWFSGGNLLVDYSAGSTRLWDVETSQIVMELESPSTWNIQNVYPGPITWSPEGNMLAAADTRSVVRVWDVYTGEILFELTSEDYAGTYLGVAWSPDGNMLTHTVSGGRFEIWDINTQQIIVTFEVAAGFDVVRPAWSPQGDTIAAMARSLNPDEYRHLWVWDLETSETLIHERYRYVGEYEWHPDGNLLAVAAEGGVLIWDLEN